MIHDSGLTIKISLKSIYCFLISILTIAAVYKFFGLGIGMGTFILAVAGIIGGILIYGRRTKVSWIPVFLMYFYFILRKTAYPTDVVLLVLAFVNMLAICKSCLDSGVIRKIIEGIAVLSTVLVFIQVASHYILGINIHYVITSLLLDSTQYGISSGSLYRVSGFFLEPAHYAEYCSMALLSVLFPANNEKANLKKAFVIAAGCLLTTSGIGIVLVAGITAWYIVFTQRKAGMRIVYIILWSFAAVFVFIILMQIGPFSMAIKRIFGEVDGYNALSGRLWAWNLTVGKMNGKELLFGYGSDSFFKGYMTGLMHIIMQYGIIGMILMAFSFLNIIIRAKENYVVCGCVCFMGMMIVANMSSVYSMVFYMGLVYSETTRILEKRNCCLDLGHNRILEVYQCENYQ